MLKPSSSGAARSPGQKPRRVAVLLLPEVHLLDFAGPVQVLFDSILGGAYRITYCSPTSEVVSAQGLALSGLTALPDPKPEDLILVPGVSTAALDRLDRIIPAEWLREADRIGAQIAAICTGAFALAKAGLLDGRKCTTHWELVDRLRAEYPRAEVLDDRLFVEDGNLMTSAGIASGIDLALALVEQDHGPLMAARVAREVVVYLRRSGDQDQRSVYLDYRAHLDPGVHRAQDYVVEHPDHHLTTDDLAHIAAMSPRNFTRVFRRATGLSPKQFASKVRLQVAKDLLDDPQRTIESIAASCGFQNARALRRLWQQVFGISIAEFRSSRKSLRAEAAEAHQGPSAAGASEIRGVRIA
jgi:transcriptional regulator GlxA family with amidase domain